MAPALKIVLGVDSTGVERGMRKAEQSVKKAANDIGGSADKIERDLKDAGDKGSKNLEKIGKAGSSAGKTLQEAFSGAKSEFSSFAQGLSGGVPLIGNFATKLGIAGVAVGAVAGGILAFSRSMADMQRTALKAGVGVEEFQKWSNAAKMNGVEVDALTDGLKELNLRADEFIKTGKGSAAESFQTLGYSIADVTKQIKEPGKFLEDIIGRVRELDAASRTRVLDEMFGGTAAEQFAYFLGVSQEKLKEMVNSGPILSKEEVARIAEVDQKFREIETTITNGVKRAVVDLFGTVDNWLEKRKDLKDQKGSTLDSGQAETDMRRLEVENRILELEDQQKTATGRRLAMIKEALITLRMEMDALNQASGAIAGEIYSRNNPALGKSGRVQPKPFDGGRFGDTSSDPAGEAKRLATAIEDNKKVIERNTTALDAAARKGMTPEQQRDDDIANIKKIGDEAIAAARAIGDLGRVAQIQAQVSAGVAGVNQQYGRSQDTNTYLSQFNPYGRDIENLQSGLAKKLQEMLAAMPDALRSQVVINSAYRDVAKQTQLWNAALKKYGSAAEARKWVAPPGSSMHNSGQAVDLGLRGGGLLNANSDVYKWIQQNSSQFGLNQRMANEPWHYEETGAFGKQNVKDTADKAKAESDYAEKVQDSNDKLKEQARSIIEANDPLAVKNRLLQEANDLLEKGFLTQEQFAAQSKRINDDYEEAMKKRAESSDKFFKELQSAAESWTNSLADGLAEMLVGGEFDFKKFAQQIAKDMISMAIKPILQNITQGIMGSGAGKAGKAGGSAAGKAGKAVTGGAATGTDNANPGVHLVGERGPEYVFFKGGEKVMSNNASKQMGSGVGGFSSSISINVQSSGNSTPEDDRRTADTIAAIVDQRVQDNLRKYEYAKRSRL